MLCSLFNVGCQVRLIPSRSCGARLGRCRRLSRVQRSPSSATPAPDGFFLAHNSFRFRGLLLDDASQRAGHLLLKSCFDVRRVFLQSSAVCFFSVPCTPWSRARGVPECRSGLIEMVSRRICTDSTSRSSCCRLLDPELDVLHEVPYDPFPPPACGLRQNREPVPGMIARTVAAAALAFWRRASLQEKKTLY